MKKLILIDDDEHVVVRKNGLEVIEFDIPQEALEALAESRAAVTLKYVRLSGRQVQDCIHELSRRYSTVLDFDQMVALIDRDQDLKNAIGSASGCCDTYEREWLAEVLAQSLGFDHWPTFGEGTFEEFWPQFVEKARQAGYSFVS